MTTNQLPEIQVSPQIYTILKIVCLIAVFTVICINVLSVNASVQIVEGINGSAHAYPDDYYNDTGFPNELIDDNLEEDEEEQDEEEHEEENDEYYDDNRE